MYCKSGKRVQTFPTKRNFNQKKKKQQKQRKTKTLQIVGFLIIKLHTNTTSDCRLLFNRNNTNKKNQFSSTHTARHTHTHVLSVFGPYHRIPIGHTRTHTPRHTHTHRINMKRAHNTPKFQSRHTHQTEPHSNTHTRW